MSRRTCFVLLAAGALSMTMCGGDVTVTDRQVSEFIDGVRTEEPVDEEESLSGLWFECEFADFDGETLSSRDGCTALDDDGFDLMDGGDLAVLEGTEETKTMGDCDGSPCFPFDADAEFVRTVIGSWTQTGQDVSITAGPCTGSFRFNTTQTYAEVTILDLAAACDSLESSSHILGGGSESIGLTDLARMHTGNASFTTGEPD